MSKFISTTRRAMAGCAAATIIMGGLAAASLAPSAQAATATTGSLAVGKAYYATPSAAVHVSTSGKDTNPGTSKAPVRTIAKAVAMVPAGGTVVVHAGSYHEELGYIAKTVTIQNVPGEAVWMDGTSVLTGFVADGSAWSAPYAYAFDSGPTFTKGQADSTQASWQFVNPNRPMAAHPDQLWVNGTELREVASRDKVVAGTFFVDKAAKKVVVGTNPSGRTVKASTMQQVVRLGGDKSVLRGIGVRGYANTQYMMGSVVSYATNATIENVVIDQAATEGLGIYRAGNTIKNVTVTSAGSTGIHASEADGLQVSNVVVTDSNTEGFNFAPAAAGMKVSRTAGLSVVDSAITNNFATGLWTDEDVRDITVARNTITGNAKNGVMLELSARAKLVGNTIVANGSWGSESVFISDSAKVELWNNTISGPRSAVRMGQDARTRATNGGSQDARTSVTGGIPAVQDADLDWQTRGVRMFNNIFQDDGEGAATLAEGRGKVSNYGIVHGQNYSGATNRQMVEASDSNVYARLYPKTPQFALVWQNQGSAFSAYGTWAAYRAAQPSMDAYSTWVNGEAGSAAPRALTPLSTSAKAQGASSTSAGA